jgi:hypothetical protein
MTITKLFPSGALEICDVIDGRLCRKVYHGYTRAEAKRAFRREFKEKGAK